jgi:hypothetical protein
MEDLAKHSLPVLAQCSIAKSLALPVQDLKKNIEANLLGEYSPCEIVYPSGLSINLLPLKQRAPINNYGE